MKFYISFKVVLTFSHFCGVLSGIGEDLVVETKYGKVKGVDLDQSYGFLGVPYGKPPVGDLRFAPPQEPVPWEGEYNADTYGTGCIQICAVPPEGCPSKISEDCLFLNIFVPKTDLSVLKPVFIFMHGGNFRDGVGGAILYDGRFLAEKADAIVITINYRLEAFGWLWLGNMTDPATGMEAKLGNFGFEDQRLSFKFVQENIAAFGGDPNRVTISGQSAGAQSAGLHLLSKESDPLFQQTVMFSNPFALPYKIPQDALKLGSEFARYLGCPNRDILCMRSKSAQQVLDASREAATSIVNARELLQIFEPWNPVVGEGSLPDEPIQAYYDAKNQRKPSMLGTLTEEGVLYIYLVLRNELGRLTYRALLQLLVPGSYAADVYNLYPPDFMGDQREPMSDLTTDYIFGCSTLNISRSMDRNNMSDVYHYIFDVAWSFADRWTEDYSMCYNRVCHGGEIPYIFRSGPLGNVTYTDDELRMMDDMTAYLGNFFHTGNPNIPVNEEMRKLQPKRLSYWPKIGEKPGHWHTLYYNDCGTKVFTDYNKENCELSDKIGYYAASPLNYYYNNHIWD